MSFGDEPELQLEMPLRFRVPSDLTFETVGHRTIAFSDIDYNMHMNNTKYPDMLCDFLPDPAHTRVIGVSLAYRKEAAYGDTLTVERAVADDGVCRFGECDTQLLYVALFLENGAVVIEAVKGGTHIQQIA